MPKLPAELATLRSDLDDALSAEIQWVGEVGSDEHLAVTGDVLRARKDLELAERRELSTPELASKLTGDLAALDILDALR